MLDDPNVIGQRDPAGALNVASEQWNQAMFAVDINDGSHDGRQINRIVVAGMGGSALAALLAKSWLSSELPVPFEVVRDYDLPAYVDTNTLVIASSYSGNTEETLSCFDQAIDRFSQVAVIASGGKLIERANQNDVANVILPSGMQPRMGVIYNLRALIAILVHFGLVSHTTFEEISSTADWLREESSQWTKEHPIDKNYAKQLAVTAVGKTPVFYGGSLTAPVAYKWKISWNENAKNTAFWNQYPEFNHNEFIGWTSHPVVKPFAIFDLVSPDEHERILKRFEVSDKLLSGKRPAAHTVNMRGNSVIAQLLWGSILADFVSIYVAILNGADPTPVKLIEKLKEELKD